MIDNPGLRWTLTVLFVVCIGLYGRQALTARAWQRRVGWSLHVLMSVAMIAMAWPVGMSVPTLLYVLVFTAGALYFVYLAVFGPQVDHPAYHAVMMAGMVVMGIAMTSAAMPAMSPTAMPAMGGGHHMADMGGGHHVADMGGGQHMADMGAPAVSWASPMWVTVVSSLAAAGFVVVALWFATLIRGPQRPYADLLMSLGMGVAFAALAI